MQKASPVEMKKCLDTVEVFKKAGILFVPMPVFSEADKLLLVRTAGGRLKEIFNKAKVAEQKIDISGKKEVE